MLSVKLVSNTVICILFRHVITKTFVKNNMKRVIISLLVAIAAVQLTSAQQANSNPYASEQEIMNLSKQKWVWMAEKNIDTLSSLFHAKSMFVHMGGSWGKEQEINVIKTSGIWYKKAEVYSASVNIIGNTAILLNDIDLLAVVGGNEVINPFMVTEVYIKEDGKWKTKNFYITSCRVGKVREAINQGYSPKQIVEEILHETWRWS